MGIRFARMLLSGALMAAVLSTAAGRAAFADGAASTRNILVGGAALGAGALLIINHNKKVHEKYAAYDHREAETAARANDAHAAYESERQAYAHEAALVAEYERETSYQHAQVVADDRRIAALERTLRSGRSQTVGISPGFVQERDVLGSTGGMVGARPVQIASYGWGSY